MIALGSWGCRPTPPPEVPVLPEVTLTPIEEAPALTPIHCAIASNSPSLAPIYVALELGYFETEGLDVEVTEVALPPSPKQTPLLNQLRQNDIDCVAQSLDGYMRTQDGQEKRDTAIISTLYTSTGADGLVVTGGIGTINDLLDQPIGGDRHHPGMLLTYQALRQLGYSVGDIQIKPLSTIDIDMEPESDLEPEPELEKPEPLETPSATEESSDTVPNEEDVKSDLDDNLPAPRPSFANIFRQEGVVAIAASEPMLGHVLADTGQQTLLTSGDFKEFLVEVLVVERSDLATKGDRYQGLMRGIDQAIALYNADRPQFLQVAAPYFDQSPQQLVTHLQGITYTSYSAVQRMMGTNSRTGSLFQSFSDLNTIHLDLGLQNGPLFYDDHIDNSLIPDLFDP